jgi:hypothetical protein
MMLSRVLFLTCFLLLAVFLRPANAYIDPGAGSYANQMILAGVLGGLFSVRFFLKNAFAAIRARIGRRSTR